MSLLNLRSGQLFAWSARFVKQIRCCLARTPRKAAQAAPAPAQHFARLTHRTLQTLRQAGLRLREGPRSWPKVLPVGELPRTAATNGLRPAGASRAGQQLTVGLSARARDPGTDLRDQPGAPASSRDTLSECGGRDRSAHHSPRCPRDTRSTDIHRTGHPLRQHADRQYVGRMDRRTGLVLHRCGERS